MRPTVNTIAPLRGLGLGEFPESIFEMGTGGDFRHRGGDVSLAVTVSVVVCFGKGVRGSRSSAITLSCREERDGLTRKFQNESILIESTIPSQAFRQRQEAAKRARQSGVVAGFCMPSYARYAVWTVNTGRPVTR